MTPIVNSLVRLNRHIRENWEISCDGCPLGMHALYANFGRDDVFILLCHIWQMPGHCMVVRLSDKRIFGPLHTENFEDIPEEEA